MSTTFDAKVLVVVGVVIVAARLCGILARRLGQPPVIGEVVAGILLGPTVLGALPGGIEESLFSAELRPVLVALGTLGVVFYVFLVGLDLRIARAPAQQRAIVSVAAMSFAVPFVLGVGLGGALWSGHATATGDVVSFSLFVGTALAVTALPVLARIVEECGLTRHASGEVAMSAAVLQEPLIWLTLALSLVLSHASEAGKMVHTLLGTAAFAVGMLAIWWKLRRPRPSVAGAATVLEGSMSVTPAIGFVCASSAASAAAGLHPVIGALAAGAALPRQRSRVWRDSMWSSVEPITRYVLLPVFLVLPGLSVNLRDLPLGGAGWVALVLVVACAGKGVTGFASARWSGMDRHDALLVGALMNTRGLVELVVLNVGYAAGILDERLFGILLLAALFTTGATGPLVRFIQRRAPRQPSVASAAWGRE
jgi:Kef-type K+ transport system membrane component KefB